MPFHAVISAQRPLSYILRQEDTGAADGESKAKFHICMCILYVYYTYIHMYYILIPKTLLGYHDPEEHKTHPNVCTHYYYGPSPFG